MPTAKDSLHGTLDALVLKTLTFGPRHGYAIVRWLREQTRDELTVEEGSLYPALYRMERDGWIEADWGTSELGRKAKFYSITDKGRKRLRAESKQFADFVRIVAPLLLPT
jgi:PadR family transcriptional regulator, regulatory protein PadR